MTKNEWVFLAKIHEMAILFYSQRLNITSPPMYTKYDDDMETRFSVARLDDCVAGVVVGGKGTL
jgi:hypothetical protein